MITVINASTFGKIYGEVLDRVLNRETIGIARDGDLIAILKPVEWKDLNPPETIEGEIVNESNEQTQ